MHENVIHVSWFLAAIIPVFSVTRYFGNHFNMLIIINAENSCAVYILWKLSYIFSGFFDEKNVWKNKMYLNYLNIY